MLLAFIQRLSFSVLFSAGPSMMATIALVLESRERRNGLWGYCVIMEILYRDLITMLLPLTASKQKL